jgi:SAM-dependent methyltransferase
MNKRSERIAGYFDTLAADRDKWVRRNRYYHNDHAHYLRYLAGTGKRVLDLGCGDGRLLAALEPAVGVGIDASPAMVALARQRHPNLQFHVGDADDLPDLGTQPFDVIVLSNLVGYLDDVQQCLENLHRFCHAETRIIVSYYNFLWQPVLRVGEWVGAKMKTPEQSWLSPDEIANLLTLADFETVKIERRLLFPKYLPLVSWLLNHIGALPLINRACLNHYVVARPLPRETAASLSSTIVIPCRNEKGNIEAAVTRLPPFGAHQEIIFVDGHSTDGTPEEIRRVIAAYPDRDIKLFAQDGTGKADAVRKGFDAARGDVLMILDADLTVPPEDLPKFYNAIAANKGEFLNGCRLVYPMEDEAMRTLNLLANKLFAMTFSWMLGQRLKDTLCGTKVIRRDAYRRLVENRAYFGEFDPFGDFDLIFGASKLNLKIVEIPIRYQNRTYGETKIHRFRHGLLLLRMVIYAYRKLKAV